MKYLFFLLLLLPILGISQMRYSTGSIDTLVIYECETRDTFTEWKAKGTGDERIRHLQHEWVYAEWADVNYKSNTTYLVYCPCGCGDTEIEARICAICGRNEFREHSWWYVQKARQSGYMKIMAKFKKHE